MRAVKVLAAAFLAVVLTSAHSGPRATLKACTDRASMDSAQYPQRIDRGTTITGVSCRENAGRIIYTYDNRLDARESKLARDALRAQAASIRTMLCTNPKLTALLRLVDMEYVYYDAENVYVGAVLNRIEDCERVAESPKSSADSGKGGSWLVVDRRKDGKAVLEINRASLVREGNNVRVWTRAVYEAAFSVEGTSSQTRKVLALNEIHCAKRTERVRRVVFLGEGDQPIIGAEKGPYETADIVPGTPKESVLRYVCSSPGTKR